MNDSDDPKCFGFFGGGNTAHCGSCHANKRCKAILVSHGFDLTAALIDDLLAGLPDVPYRDVDRIPEMVKQLKSPPDPLPAEVEELLRMSATADEMGEMDL